MPICKPCNLTRVKNWQKENNEKEKIRKKQWIKNNTEKMKYIERNKSKKQRYEILNTYVCAVLSKLSDRNIKQSYFKNEIELIEVKRLQLTLHRLIKKYEHLQNNLGI
jgi:Cys-tRNA synthase (O-phospho-L-seryl-tRNA:Cys-tRNA synthase)